MLKEKLTRKQTKVLDQISYFIDKEGYVPSYRKKSVETN